MIHFYQQRRALALPLLSGTKRFDSERAGDREVQRTMLELLNQLDGFQPNQDIKVIAATNRVDILDPALLRSGRLDRKIEFPGPNEDARARIMQIHSRKMNVRYVIIASIRMQSLSISLSLAPTSILRSWLAVQTTTTVLSVKRSV